MAIGAALFGKKMFPSWMSSSVVAMPCDFYATTRPEQYDRGTIYSFGAKVQNSTAMK